MQYDVIIKNAMIVDGSGSAAYPGDIGIKGSRIVTVGRVRAPAGRVIDAEGHAVTPGFVDGHTHMDAQVFWDPLGSSSCYHGVTTAIMGNCGFTLAPCPREEADYVFRNLERAEDLPRESMLAGIDWRWESFPEFLDVVDALPKGINYGGYIGHSALRTYVMRERAFSEQATSDELARMEHEVRTAIKAGAIGFSTSRTYNHLTSDDRPVASRVADWSEVRALVNAMGETGAGIFEIASETPGRKPERQKEYFDRLVELTVESGRPLTYGMFSTRLASDVWRPFYEVANEAARAGGRIFVQCHSRHLSTLLSFETHTPFDTWEVWRDLRAHPLEEQKRLLRDPDWRRRLLDVATRPYDGPMVVGAEARPPEWDWLWVMNDIGVEERMDDVGAKRGVHPAEAMIDLALERDFKVFFRQPLANEDQEHALEMMRHPRSVVTFSDSGAHVAQIMDSSLQTHLLSHWVREKQEFTFEQAVRLITYDTATAWGLHDRGLIREGMNADLLVIDPQTVAPLMPTVEHDLPAGAKRLVQKSTGIRYTLVNGQVMLEDCRPTGALPGRLARGPLAVAR
ncbi:MAG: amidohydrolase family protein [Gammaproteobacteria bacterium]|nr:amidohydrolase family protein [Gammaproteobacteria bacterium]